MCGERLKDTDADLSESLKTLGRVLLTEIGGSMGPLYGTFFIRMARRCRNEAEIDRAVFKDMLNDALAGVSELGNAKVGDKTLMDVLIPSTQAFNQAVDDNMSFPEALTAMKVAAKAGMESTRDMVARVGRASRLGERSRGVLDAGSVSCNLLIASIADSIIKLLNN
jgi:dihydroxyacetone kinase-like protein